MHLSRRITSEKQLRDLGTGALKLEDNVITNALYEKAHSIQDAAREVLLIWANMQLGRREAYVNLQEALIKCQMNLLVAYLRTLVEGTEDVVESKNFSIYRLNDELLGQIICIRPAAFLFLSELSFL